MQMVHGCFLTFLRGRVGRPNRKWLTIIFFVARCWNPPNHPARTRTWLPTYPNGPSLAHHWPNIAANGPNTALHRSPLEPTHAPHSPTWSNVDLGPTLARHSFQMAPKNPSTKRSWLRVLLNPQFCHMDIYSEMDSDLCFD